MEQYINKSTLVKEIEKMRDKAYPKSDWNHGYVTSCEKILSFLDTLKVKEVNLEQEIQQHINDCLNIKFPTTDIKLIAKDVEYTARKFFELGMKVGNKTKKDVSYVKIDRNVLFEMCDAILNHDGYADMNDCPENNSPYFVNKWDSVFRKKVENIRNNS